jgi:hypothetical protein
MGVRGKESALKRSLQVGDDIEGKAGGAILEETGSLRGNAD